MEGKNPLYDNFFLSASFVIMAIRRFSTKSLQDKGGILNLATPLQIVAEFTPSLILPLEFLVTSNLEDRPLILGSKGLHGIASCLDKAYDFLDIQRDYLGSQYAVAYLELSKNSQELYDSLLEFRRKVDQHLWVPEGGYRAFMTMYHTHSVKLSVCFYFDWTLICELA